MILRNETVYDDSEVRALVREGFGPLSHTRVLVRVKHTRVSKRRRDEGGAYLYGASGRAHSYVFVRPDIGNAEYELHLRIGRPDDFPVAWHDRGYGVPIGTLADWREALVTIAAHEARHVQEYRERNRGQRRRGREIEAVCDSYASGAIRRYRESAA